MPYSRIDGARFGSNDQAMAYAQERVADAHAIHGETARISHIADGIHVDTSSHYRACAFDFGLVHIAPEKRQRIVDDVVSALEANGPYSDFIVLFGDDDHQHHGHVQWKPVRAMNR